MDIKEERLEPLTFFAEKREKIKLRQAGVTVAAFFNCCVLCAQVMELGGSVTSRQHKWIPQSLI